MISNWLGADLLPALITYFLSFIILFIGSITDLKTREVPDWVNYGLILSGVGLNLLFSVIYSHPSFIINSLVGLGIFFGIAYIMFYAGQWGGGDSKMLMGLGAAIGLDITMISKQFLLAFLINSLFIGAVYGLFWSFFLVFKNKRKFWKAFKALLSNKKIALIKKIILASVVFCIVSFFFIKSPYIRLIILSLAFLVLTTFYLWIFVKAIEKSCMHKLVEPSKLTEGDWIVKNIYIDGKYVTGPKDLGISKSKIRKLIDYYKKRKVRKILIKEGIPFVPSFFIAFIATFVFGSPVTWIM